MPNIRLSLTSRPEHLAIVRELLRALADGCRLEEVLVADMQTAVSEACNNVIQHAYAAAAGPMDIDVQMLEGAIEVSVADRGSGVEPVLAPPGQAIWDVRGLGLTIMSALSDSMELRTRGDGGLKVRLRFASPTVHALQAPADPVELDLGEPRSQAGGTRMALAIGPPGLAATVLPRVLGAIVARSHLSTDRISDLLTVADAIASNAPRVTARAHLRAHATARGRSVELRVGPLTPGGTEWLLAACAVRGLGPLVERLSDEQHTVRDGFEGEALVMRIGQNARQPPSMAS